MFLLFRDITIGYPLGQRLSLNLGLRQFSDTNEPKNPKLRQGPRYHGCSLTLEVCGAGGSLGF